MSSFSKSSDGSDSPIFDEDIDIVNYIQVLLRRKKFIFATTLCFILTGLMFLFFNKKYEAQTMVLLSLKMEQKSKGSDPEKGIPGFELIMPTLAADTYEILATTSDLSRSLYDTLKAAQADTSVTLPTYNLEASLIGQSGNTNLPTQLMTLGVTSSDREFSVEVANTWTRLFVERNRGLSSGVANSYHDWVENQYRIAEENLTNTERALQDLDAQHHSLNILQHEVGIKNEELSTALKTYQSLEVSLASQVREKAYLDSVLAPLEVNGEWIGFLDVEHLSSLVPPSVSKNREMRNDLIKLVFELEKLEQDSTKMFQNQSDKRQEFAAYAKNRQLSFRRDNQILSVRKQVEHLDQVLETYRTELPDLESKIKNLDLELSVYSENLKKEEPFLYVAKAITDDALWDQTVSKGRILEDRQKNIARYKLQTEEVNPIYQLLARQESDLRINRELFSRRVEFLRSEIPLLQSELIQVQTFLDTLESKEQALNHDLSDRKFLLSKQIDVERNQIIDKIARRRKSFEEYRSFYFERKQQQAMLEWGIQRIETNIVFQRRSFLNWREEIQTLTVITDSLQLARTKLQRNSEVYTETFQRFSRLLEEARISLEQAAGDLQVISWASNANAISNVRYLIIICLASLLVAVCLAFALEFIDKARDRLKTADQERA